MDPDETTQDDDSYADQMEQYEDRVDDAITGVMDSDNGGE